MKIYTKREETASPRSPSLFHPLLFVCASVFLGMCML